MERILPWSSSRDDIQNHVLAKELVAFLNLEGGTVLLGVEDDSSISGTTRDRLEEWVSELCRVKINPPTVPVLLWVKDAEPNRDVLAISISRGPDKPYACVHSGRRTLLPTCLGTPPEKRAERSSSGCTRSRGTYDTV